MPNFPSWFGIIVVVALVFSELALCAFPAWLWAIIGRQKLVEAFSWRRASGREYLGATLLAIGMVGWVEVLTVIQNHVWPRSMAGQQASNAFLLPLIQHYAVVMILALPLSAAFSEELLFRGVLQRALVKRVPVWLAVSLGSLLFSAVHLDVQGFIVRTLLGVLLSTLVLRGRSIFPAMLTHFVYDAVLIGGAAWDLHVQGLSTALRVAGQVNAGLSRLELILYAAVGTVLMLGGWTLCAGAWRRKQKEMSAEPPPGDGVWPSAPQKPEEIVGR